MTSVLQWKARQVTPDPFTMIEGRAGEFWRGVGETEQQEREGMGVGEVRGCPGNPVVRVENEAGDGKRA